MELTDLDALTRLITAQGVISFTEHDEEGSDGSSADECIAFAIAYVKGRLAAMYPPAVLANAPILREWTTVIAARTLCTRRGNPIPDSLEMRYQEIIDPRSGFLTQVFTGIIALVDANGSIIIGKPSSAPVMSNLRIDRRYPNKSVRVVRQTTRPVDSKLTRDIGQDGGFFNG